LEGALLELLEHKPLEQITVRDITAAAGINYATFFRHHPTKESLLDQIASDQMRRLVELTLPVFDAADVAAANRALFTYVDENRALWTALLTGGAAGTLRDEHLRLSQEVAAERGAGDQESWLPFELGVSCTAATIFETLVWWLAQPQERYSIEQAAELLTKLIGGKVLVSEGTRRSRGSPKTLGASTQR
jgi:AcrR family transcriptional regulator